MNYPLQSQPSYHGSYYPQYLNGNDPVPLASNHPVPLAPAVHPVLLAASLQPRQQLGSRHQAEAAASFFRTQAQPPPRLARLPSLGSQTEEEPEPLPVAAAEASPPPAELPVRGVPDGCGLDVSLQRTPGPITSASTPDTSKHSTQIPIPSPHELLNLKKGWLMKQSPTKDWHKHWFVLQGTALMYFRDPSAENNGLLDGIIDLGLVQKVGHKDITCLILTTIKS